MSWIEALYNTYEKCAGHEPEKSAPLSPIAHTTVIAHIEVILNSKGEFLRANVLEKGEGKTLIPCTESSGGRSGSRPINHPLCDSLQYVAGDFVSFGGTVTSGFKNKPEEPHENYYRDLSAWQESFPDNIKLSAIRNYVSKKTLVADLVKAHILPLDEKKILVKTGTKEEKEKWKIWKALSNTATPEDAVIRWRVEILGQPDSTTWEDKTLMAAWIDHYQQKMSRQALCQVSGKIAPLAGIQPAKLRNDADKAKLISSNDNTGYTFRGRFESAEQACSLSFEVTQKAHNALRWLLNKKRSFRYGEQAIVAWELSGKDIPSPCESSHDLDEMDELPSKTAIEDAGRDYAQRLKSAIAGYAAKLDTHAPIVVMVLDAATPGRMSIRYYRELHSSDFLKRVQCWHKSFAWKQNFGKEKRFTGSPSPYDIVCATYGEEFIRQDKKRKLLKASIERLLPCILDGTTFPEDLWHSLFNRACRPESIERWEWNKVLGIACAIFRGKTYSQEEYKMALDTERRTRDYLYGRLLAVADRIEGAVLRDSEENRATNAEKMMARFADHPCSTWRQLATEKLKPYEERLGSGKPGILFILKKIIDEISHRFLIDDFVSDTKLGGEFLIGYYNQREALYDPTYWAQYKKKAETEIGKEVLIDAEITD